VLLHDGDGLLAHGKDVAPPPFLFFLFFFLLIGGLNIKGPQTYLAHDGARGDH
jgi:hypothetical protein